MNARLLPALALLLLALPPPAAAEPTGFVCAWGYVAEIDTEYAACVGSHLCYLVLRGTPPLVDEEECIPLNIIS